MIVAVVHDGKNSRETGGGGSHLPCKIISGSVMISCSPPSGTRHTRIFASSPACRVETDTFTLRHSLGSQNETTGRRMLPAYPRRDGVCRKGPRRSRPR